MVENVTKRRRVRSLALLGLCIAAAVVWLLYYHNRTYLSDAVANVDGTIETGSNAVELALNCSCGSRSAVVSRMRWW